MQRCCFTLQIKKDRIRDYLTAHQVWPEMLQAMRDAGIRNYSMFMAEDGLAVGYLEADNVEEALRKAAQTDVSRRWQQSMAEFIECTGDAATRVDRRLEEYFHLE